MSLKKVNTINEIPATNQWVTAEVYNKIYLLDDKGKSVSSNYSGRKFLLVERKEYVYTKSERIIRGLFGLIATICTLVVGIFFIKSIQNLFTKQRKSVDFCVPFTSEQEKLIAEYSPEMIEALGGVCTVMNLPKYKRTWGPHEYTFKEIIKDPVSLIEGSEKPTIIFSYAIPSYSKNVWEQLERHDNKWRSIRTICGSTGQLHLGIPLGTLPNPSVIVDNSLEAEFMFKKIRRLVLGDCVGVLKKYKDVDKTKPENKDVFRPSDAYLKGSELESYMDAKPLEYEHQPKEGATEVYLFDPKKTPEENLTNIQKKFPNTVLIKPVSLFCVRRASTGQLRSY